MKRTPVLFAALCASLVLAGPASADDGSWKQVVEAEYGFRVLMPVAPEETAEKRNFHVGEVVNHIFTAMQGQEMYKVDCTRLPGMALEFVGADEILDRTRSGILDREMARQTGYAGTSLGKLPCKRLTYETPATSTHPGWKGVALIVIDGKNLYVVEARVPKSDTAVNTDRFLGSFQVNGVP
jgi:hypothetical protein